MRHQNKKYRIGSDSEHRASLLKNLASAVICNGKIKSTLTKCRAVKPYVEKLVTLAKVDNVANRRRAVAKLNSKEAVKKLFTEVAPKFKTRPGGYTRIIKASDNRLGDNAQIGFLCFLE